MSRLEATLRFSSGPESDTVAVEWGSDRLSYRELDRLANRMARCFLAAGIKRGDRLGLHLPRSGRGIVAMLAALRVGAVYVPLDPSSPAARTQWIARDCELSLVVTLPQLLAAWQVSSELRPQLLLAETLGQEDQAARARFSALRLLTWNDVLSHSAEPLAPCQGSPDELAYILYTSGSTGTPKGVMLSHGNAMAFVEWAANEITLTTGDRVASVAPFHFDLSVFDIWATLSRGATLVIVDEASVVSGDRMLSAIHERNLHVWYSVPSAWMLMLESGLEARGAPSLRVVFFAGEVFPMGALRRTMAALAQARFYNLFGPTETNVCIAHALSTMPAADALAIPIGQAVCGDDCSVVDEQGMPVPLGEIGELRVEGPTVMLGYWENGTCRPAPRPYPTGDLVSQRADGAFMYHGRRDHQIKIHGFRIELAEVEAALHAHERIREALVLVMEQRLIALVVALDGELSVMDVRRHCAARLPRYMLPSEVRLVSEFPRTGTGKIDRVRACAAYLAGDWALFAGGAPCALGTTV